MKTTCKTYTGGLLFAALVTAVPAGAAELGADAIRKLVGGTAWSTEKLLNYKQTRTFEWKKDGTVCLRLDDERGKCDDSGTWKIVGQRVCYELTWWMKSNGMMSECLGVADLGNGRYEARLANGTPVMEFTVSK